MKRRPGPSKNGLFSATSKKSTLARTFVDNKSLSARELIFVDERGTATVEYIVILTLVSLGVALALISIGPTFFRMFLAQVIWVLLPFS